jgi:hypothetical protein
MSEHAQTPREQAIAVVLASLDTPYPLGPVEAGLDALLARPDILRELAGQAEPLHEVECPSCSATIRARMADASPSAAPSASEPTGNCGVGHDPDRISCKAAAEIVRLRAEVASLRAAAETPPAEPRTVSSRQTSQRMVRERRVAVEGRPELPVNPHLPIRMEAHTLYVDELRIRDTRAANSEPWATESVQVCGQLRKNQRSSRYILINPAMTNPPPDALDLDLVPAELSDLIAAWIS